MFLLSYSSLNKSSASHFSRFCIRICWPLAVMTCCLPFLLASACYLASFSFPTFCPYLFTLPITSVQSDLSQRSASQLILNKNPLVAGSHDMLSPFLAPSFYRVCFLVPCSTVPYLFTPRITCISRSLIGKYERVHCIAKKYGCLFE